jgi:hypothetical protein
VFELVVDDAGTATADAVQAMSTSVGEVESVRELRPTFEEVFTTLVERDEAAREPAAEAEADAETPGVDAEAA